MKSTGLTTAGILCVTTDYLTKNTYSDLPTGILGALGVIFIVGGMFGCSTSTSKPLNNHNQEQRGRRGASPPPAKYSRTFFNHHPVSDSDSE